MKRQEVTPRISMANSSIQQAYCYPAPLALDPLRKLEFGSLFLLPSDLFLESVGERERSQKAEDNREQRANPREQMQRLVEAGFLQNTFFLHNPFSQFLTNKAGSCQVHAAGERRVEERRRASASIELFFIFTPTQIDSRTRCESI